MAKQPIPNKQLKRFEALLPNEIPRYVRLYDNNGETADRYTCVFSGRYRARGEQFLYLGMSSDPFHPQGFGQHGYSWNLIDLDKNGWPIKIGQINHLGKRIQFWDLPEKCKVLVLRDYLSIWKLSTWFDVDKEGRIRYLTEDEIAQRKEQKDG